MTSCQFTNELNREMSRGVFQNREVCGQAFPLLPSPPPSIFVFCFRSNFRAITRLETLATQASSIWVAIPVDLVILRWYARGADGRADVRSRDY